jgi:hypothetical protein
MRQDHHMNGELASLIALCLYGNDWLASDAVSAPALETENSTFKYVKKLDVIGSARGLFRHPAWKSDGTAAWLRYLRKTGARRLTLITTGTAADSDLDDHIAVSFVNGGRWAIASDGPDPRVWRSEWSIQDRDDPNRRIWAVQIIAQSHRNPMVPAVNLASARTDLNDALRHIHGFAERNDLSQWAEWFTKALGLLESPEPVVPYNPDLAPAVLPIESRQILAAAVQSWVFGGMGSWNDIGFEDNELQRSYADLTKHLYITVLAAIATVTNATRS